MDPVVGRFIGNVKKALAEHAEYSMRFPKPDPFEHGRQVGIYQGLGIALDHLEDVLNSTQEEQS